MGPAGQVTKACNQILTGVTVMAVAEAFNFARKSGVDAGKVREASLGGFAYSRILENHGQRMLDRNFKPGFKAWMHQKDMNIVMQEAHRLGLAAQQRRHGPALQMPWWAVAWARGFRHRRLKLLESPSGNEVRVGFVGLGDGPADGRASDRGGS